MMFDIQRTMDALSTVLQVSRANYHLTLGALLAAIEPLPADRPVVFDTGGGPAELDSYRGYYEDLAFARSDNPAEAGPLRAVCLAALGHTFTGYKGGEFVMGPSTPLWAAEYGSTGRAIVGVTVTDALVELVTKDVG